MGKLSSTERSNILWIVIVFVVMGLSYVLLNDMGNRLLSGTRAYFAGQNQWTLAQKRASLALVRYIQSGEEDYWTDFKEHFTVIEGDKRAREMLNLEPPDEQAAFEGFQAGKNNPRDIPHLIWMYKNFADYDPISNAVKFWEEGEVLAEQMLEIGNEFRQLHARSELIAENIRTEYLDRIFALDEEISTMQLNFSHSINQAAYGVEDFVYWFTLGIVLLLGILAALTTTYQIRNVRRWNEELRQKDQKFKGVLENSRDVIYQMNLKNGKYEYMSPAVLKMTGYTAEEIMGGGPELMLKLTHPDDVERMMKELNELDEGILDGKNDIPDTEFRIKKKGGDYIWVNNKRSIIKNGENGEISIIGNVRDITERKKYVHALDNSLKEKDMLLSEIHHRVKNNLSIVSSLIELQKGSLENPQEEVFQEIQSRIKSIALVHEKLYQTETLADVDLAEYIRDLKQMISSTFFSADRAITIEDELEPMIVNIKQAVPIGLICNELVNNCYKHAFKGQKKGRIKLSLQSENGTVKFSVFDDGKGLPEDFSLESQTSLGMTLLKALTQQLKGELNYNSDNGCRFTVCFPKKENT